MFVREYSVQVEFDGDATRIARRVALHSGCFLVCLAIGCKRGSTPERVPATAASPVTFPSTRPAVNGVVMLLSPGKYDAELFELTTTPRLRELAAKMQTGMIEHAEWWKSHASEQVALAGGGRLPYNDNLGLTKTEYTELLELYEQQRPEVSDHFKLQIERVGSRIYFTPDTARLGFLRELSIFVPTGELLTRIGSVPGPTSRSADAKTDGFGPWPGYDWNFADPAGTDPAAFVRMTIGPTPATGHVMIHYRLHVAEGGRCVQQEEALFRFQP